MLPSLIVGCGYLGLRVAKAWQAQGRAVHALTRTRCDEFRVQGITPIMGDVMQLEPLQFPPVKTVLYAVGLDRRSGKTMSDVYRQGLRNVLTRLAGIERVIYISSTSAYGQTDGEWVDESSETVPLEDSGHVVLQAEGILIELRPDAIRLRFAGIYGPGRILRQASLLKGELVPGEPERYLNLIHVDDGVQAVLCAENSARPGEMYLISDGHPPTRRELFTETARLIGAPPVTFAQHSSDASEANRRIDSTKARLELGFLPKYTSFRDGLPASIS